MGTMLVTIGKENNNNNENNKDRSYREMDLNWRITER